MSGTSAAFTDTATATSSFSSAGKFLPAVDYVYCDTVSDGWWDATREAKLRWPHIGAPFRYQVLVYQDNGVVAHTSSIIDPGSAAAGTVFYYGIDEDQVGQHTGWAYTARVYTVSPSGERSTDWRGERLSQPAILTVKCDGSRSSISAASGERALRMAPSSSESVTPTTIPDATTAGKSSATATPTTPKATTTSTTPGTSTSTSTPSSEPARTTAGATTTAADSTKVDPTPSAATSASTAATSTAAERVPSPSGEHTASVSSDESGTFLVVYDVFGEIVYRTAVSADSTMAWLPNGDIGVDSSAGERIFSGDNWTR